MDETDRQQNQNRLILLVVLGLEPLGWQVQGAVLLAQAEWAAAVPAVQLVVRPKGSPSAPVCGDRPIRNDRKLQFAITYRFIGN